MIPPVVRARLREIRAALGFVPTRRTAAAIAVLAAVMLVTRLPGGAIIGWLAVGIVATFVVVDVAMLPRSGDLEVHREFPATVGVGDRADGVISVYSRWKRPLQVTVFDALPARFLADSRPFTEHVLPAQGRLEQPFTVLGAARGDVALGDVAVRVTTMLGLAARTFRYQRDDHVLIAPSLAGVKRFRWLAVHHRLATAGVRTARRKGEGRNFARLRDYAVGDDPRHIDWKATARRGHPVTREYTIEQSQTVFVLVDAGRSMTQLSGGYTRFEYALSATLLLADVALTAGDRVGAMVFDDALKALVPAQRGSAALAALRTALVPTQPTMVEPDYAAAFRVLAQRQRKRALIVLVTDVLDARTSRTLLAHLTRGGSHHLAVVVALRNESLLATANSISSGSAGLYANGAAAELVAERLTALQRMRDAGIVVLDVAPDAMAAAVVNQYLELKSRGAL